MRMSLAPAPWPCQAGRKCFAPCPGCPGPEGDARSDSRRDDSTDSVDPLAKANLAAGDLALLHAAATGEGVIELTPERIEAIGAAITTRQADIEARYPGLVAAAPINLRIDAAIACVRALFRHAREGGSYRFLIYERLEFGPDAYMPLLDAGMALSNDLEIDPRSPDPLATANSCARDAVAHALERFPTAENDTRLAVAATIFEAIANCRDPVGTVVLPSVTQENGAQQQDTPSPASLRAFLETCGLAVIENAWRKRGSA